MTHSVPSQPNRFWRDFAVVAALAGAVCLLYGPSLTYPFIWHEADDLSRTLRYTPIQYITGMPSYEYYRPLMFLFWRSILDAWGAASAPIFHAYSLAMHLLNSVLLYAFARAVSNHRTLAAVAALLFVTYPFSYQAYHLVNRALPSHGAAVHSGDIADLCSGTAASGCRRRRLAVVRGIRCSRSQLRDRHSGTRNRLLLPSR